MSAATLSCLLSTRGGVASSSSAAAAAAAAAAKPATAIRRRSRPPAAADFVKPSSSPSYSRLVSTRAEPLGSKETVQPFDEGAAQVQRLLKRDRLELLGEGDSLEDFISASEFADGDGGGSGSKASSSSSAAAAADAAAAPISAAPVSPFGGASPTSPFGGAAAGGGGGGAGADSASLGGGLRGSVFGSGGAAASPFAAGGLPTAQGAQGLYKEAERMPGEMNRGLFGEGDESYNIPSPSRNGGSGGDGGFPSKEPWWSGISLSQVVIAASFLFTISLMLATAWFVNSVGAIRFNE